MDVLKKAHNEQIHKFMKKHTIVKLKMSDKHKLELQNMTSKIKQLYWLNMQKKKQDWVKSTQKSWMY